MFIRPRGGKSYVEYYLVLHNVLIKKQSINIPYKSNIKKDYLIKLFCYLVIEINPTLIKSVEENKIIFKNGHYIALVWEDDYAQVKI